jgi:cytochrome c-type protein NapB
VTRLSLPRRWLAVAIAVIGPVALMGYLTGARPPEITRPPASKVTTPAADLAPSYAQLRSMRRGANAQMYDGAFQAFARRSPVAADEPQPPEAARASALARRRERRAYDGAPPTIPHKISQLSAADCVACHSAGLTLADKRAPKPPHAYYAGCTQCHVVDRDPRPAAPVKPLSGNVFAGLESPTRGARAWFGAPPTIPHPTLMRGECNSCHGPGGRAGMRTPHPERQGCQQCHTPSATLDQRRTTGTP